MLNLSNTELKQLLVAFYNDSIEEEVSVNDLFVIDEFDNSVDSAHLVFDGYNSTLGNISPWVLPWINRMILEQLERVITT